MRSLPNGRTIGALPVCATMNKKPVKPPPPEPQPGPAPAGRARPGFRRLSWDEVVSRGDFSAADNQPLEAWEGPTGFRASSFIKPTYRKGKSKRPARPLPKT